jgi:hypothetical protein
MPCTDGLSHETSHEISDKTHEHHDSEHEDDCPPFCICSCCGSIATYSSIETPSSVISLFTKEYLSTYKFDYSFDYNEGIWHPPAIS